MSGTRAKATQRWSIQRRCDVLVPSQRSCSVMRRDAEVRLHTALLSNSLYPIGQDASSQQPSTIELGDSVEPSIMDGERSHIERQTMSRSGQPYHTLELLRTNPPSYD